VACLRVSFICQMKNRKYSTANQDASLLPPGRLET
jgi:hypothetical protein